MEQRAHFTRKMDDLKVQVLRMSSMAETAMRNAVKALAECNAELAEDVIMNDIKINELECELDKYNIELLALDQPMARDLRFIVGTMRMTSNLERIGDEAVNLAHRAVFLSTRPPMPFNQLLEQMAGVTGEMVSLAVKSFADEDPVLAAKVCGMDNDADSLNLRILKGLIENMVSETRIVERGVHLIMAASHLERIADQATNIAESVIFISQGVNIKHQCRG
ncbi:phosphate signaling complex protein PhoU [Maridesulfovibrio hydrothermalis]|uniref:Phosphate-specific transport system accessory protein PhoU n=1 Tax=Maridesulfovibrio hydrothermalis AM13 = DSM 14728 TaxID=1121451 RepID=L0R8Z2_9BACT|nr:phosphate signaling complex protein PhoU [Maridesulfovibrio hydrothermalis]CCO22692.1 Phosphate uptake regulator, PhoU [Maridesulfovibrio hydrothermalis AM13 = DSM 14728]